jgi:Holliday junction DNA helicase RuvA
MIKRIKGEVTHIAEKKISLTVANGLIELELLFPNSRLIELGKEYFFCVAMVFSPESGYSLYGFLSEIEKNYFLLLQDCRGVGPKLAITILDSLSLSVIYRAINEKNSNIFSSISGVGQKKAESILLELYSKIKKIPIPESVSSEDNGSAFAASDLKQDLEDALVSLGYAKKEVDKMMKKVLNQANVSTIPLIDLLRQAME